MLGNSGLQRDQRNPFRSFFEPVTGPCVGLSMAWYKEQIDALELQRVKLTEQRDLAKKSLKKAKDALKNIRKKRKKKASSIFSEVEQCYRKDWSD